MSIVFYTATTVNGFLADSDDSLDWLFAVPGQHPDATAFIDDVSVMVTGSTTYQWLLSHEDLLARPAKWHTYFGDKPMFVFTSHQLSIPDGADVRLLAGSVSDHIGPIQHEASGGTIWVQGGGDLAGQFLDAGLLDEINLTVAPAFLAAGRPLLPRAVGADRLHLRSVSQVGEFATLRYAIVNRGTG